jgi:hypothetical protein
MKKDPDELNNIYGSKKMKKVTKKLKQQLLDLIEKYKDEEAKKLFYEPIN